MLQLETVFLRASMVANRRPIAARLVTEKHFYAITSADLLLGRATDGMLRNVDDKFWLQEQEAADLAPEIRGRLETLVNDWWRVWIQRAFPLLLPRRKWAIEHRDVKVGDIVHLQYKAVVSRSRYRIARVMNVHPDEHGVVRTVTVAVRDRVGLGSEAADKCRTSKQHLRVGVQRLVMLLPREDQGPSPEELPVPHHTARKHSMMTRAKARAPAPLPGGTVDL